MISVAKMLCFYPPARSLNPYILRFQFVIIPQFVILLDLCGKYNANYSCPPGCGTVEEVHRRLFTQEKALVVEMIWEVNGFDDKEFIFSSRNKLNRTVLQLMDQLRQKGMDGFCLGYGGCPLCNPCKQTEGKPCAFPEKKISCMSAYCIDVGKLAKKCELPFAWSNDKMHLFGLIAFHEKE